MFWKIVCFPTIWRNVPTEPEIALNILPVESIIKLKAAMVNSSPNILNMSSGNIKNNRRTGILIQKIVLVDCFTIFFNDSTSPEECNSENFGAAILFTDINPMYESMDNFNAIL